MATLAAAAVSGVQFAVQQWPYVSDETGWSGVARIAMGWPLTILAGSVVVWGGGAAARGCSPPGPEPGAARRAMTAITRA